MTHVVLQHCCNDASCVAACPVNCIHPTPDEPGYATAEMLYIDPDGCVDCGACVDACPVGAIMPDFELTAVDQPFAKMNAEHFASPAHKRYSARPYQRHKRAVEVTDRLPLRVAVVGSGPAGAYAAHELLSCGTDVQVRLFERLATPWGLVRYGVAPDHQRTKSVVDLFEKSCARRDLDLHLNVEVGKHVSHRELLDHHHAVIYAVGAHAGRDLGLPGEHLPGSHSAAEFVAWYNSHPAYVDQTYDLSTERAVIIGNGNVALDVARILLTDVEDLARTDIGEHALEALAANQISEVLVLGRRDAAAAAFSAPELVGVMNADGFEVRIDPQGASELTDTPPVTSATTDDFKHDLLRRLAARPARGLARRMTLRFRTSPVAILGGERVTGIRVVRNEPLVGADVDDTGVRPTDVTADIECGLVVRATGYRGSPMAGLPFDQATATLPNRHGRVVDPASDEPLTGVYTAGWIKRGPSGVIGTNKSCAEETVQQVLDDYATGRLVAPTGSDESLRDLIARRQPQAIGYEGWQAIDRHERCAGSGFRTRVKLTSLDEMVAIARGTSASICEPAAQPN